VRELRIDRSNLIRIMPAKGCVFAMGAVLVLLLGNCSAQSNDLTNNVCDKCHVKNAGVTLDFSSADPQLEKTPCGAWRDNACCSFATANASNADVPVYGVQWDWDRCGKLSPKCASWFVAEHCFYECDVNMGRYRLFPSCFDSETDDINAWQISRMPIRAADCDQWFEDCKDDIFGTGETRTFFDWAEEYAENETLGCKKFSAIYKNGKEVCEVMWADNAFRPAFIYSNDTKNSYTFRPPVGGPNPNNVLPNPKPFPTTCQIRSVDEIHFNQSVSTGCAGMRPPAHGPQNALTPSASKTSPSATLRIPLALAAILILACARWGAAEPWY